VTVVKASADLENGPVPPSGDGGIRNASSTRSLAPPRAAAIAGVVFSVLFGASIVIVRLAIPAYRNDVGNWVTDPLRRDAIEFATQLTPFAGIAFLWFIAVLRNRIGEDRDQFFTTVFMGSGLLFVASVFVSAMLAGGLLESIARSPTQSINSDAFYLVRHAIGAAMNIFAIRMAGVFMISTSTIVLRTHMLSRWVAFSGFACALILLLIITSWPWIVLLLPLWILIVSIQILIADMHPVGRAGGIERKLSPS
jgi:hypothetical protein